MAAASLRTVLGASFVLGTLVAVGCGSSGDSEFGDNTGSSGGSSGASGGLLPPSGSSGSSGQAGCTGLQCNQVACGGGSTTSLSGKVYDPSGTVPLYNAIVYVPNQELAPFVDEIACDKCGTAPSGAPITTALSNAKGEFTLKNVPVGVDIPLVVQIGRWRRKVTIPAVKECVDTPIEAAATRLPRHKGEGDVPRIAITTGGADSLECFVRKLGVESEMTNPDGQGRVHIYQGKRNNNDGSRIDSSTPTGAALWDDAAKLKQYDIVILSCEGSENLSTKSAQARENVKAYLDAGGRVFASHYHYTWIKNASSPYPTTADWTNGSSSDGNKPVRVDTTFAKGQAFSQWLDAVGATSAPDTVDMTELKRSLTAVPGPGAAPEVSRRWLYTDDAPKFYSFNTPVGLAPEQQCGRGVYTDIHVSSGDEPGGTFPDNCTTTGYTAQEKALLFLMMDLASCIQDDSKPPEAPPPVVK